MKKNQIICSFLFMFASLTNVYSQKNFVSGYIVDLTGDTINGLIDYQNWTSNPTNVKFKQVNDSEIILYTPEKILEFGAGDDIYISRKVKIENSPNEKYQLDERPELSIIERNVFLKTLVKGEKSIYLFNDKDIKENFYIDTDSGLSLLIYKRYLNKVIFNTYQLKYYKYENNSYKNILNRYLNDCSSIDTKINKSSYNQSELLDIFKTYYLCLNKKPKFLKKYDKMAFKFGVLTGISLTDLKFNSIMNQFNFLSKWNSNSSVDFTSAVFLDLVFPANRNKLSLYNELMFAKYGITGMYSSTDSYSQNYEYNTTYNLSYIKLNNLIRYNYLLGDAKIFINGGLSNGFAVNKNCQKTTTIRIGENKTSNVERVTDLRLFEQSLLIGTGLKYDRFSLEFRYELGNGISAEEGLSSVTSRYFLLIGYQIN